MKQSINLRAWFQPILLVAIVSLVSLILLAPIFVRIPAWSDDGHGPEKTLLYVSPLLISLAIGLGSAYLWRRSISKLLASNFFWAFQVWRAQPLFGYSRLSVVSYIATVCVLSIHIIWLNYWRE